ncbi:MAG: Gx transporter family protein [Treponema sp.]|nr:Gx transporter family protein [Treponema sp.]
MQSRNKIAYLISLTLFFSYVEMLLPRITPFFRLGLSNIAVLNAFYLPLKPFVILLFTKAIAVSMMNGTLFTPFLIISVCQSLSSGILMFFLNKIREKNPKSISIYGISIAGSGLSAVIQIALCLIWLGEGTKIFLGPMLALNTVTGFLTAFLSEFLNIPQKEPVLNSNQGRAPALSRALRCPLSPRLGLHPKTRPAIFASALILLLCAGTVFFINSIQILIAVLILSLFLQFLFGRKILISPHIFMWLFILISQLFLPEGKIIFSFHGFSLTVGALQTGIIKALKLSSVSALSQCATCIKLPETSLIGKSLLYHRALSDLMRSSEGSLLKKVRTALSARDLSI